MKREPAHVPSSEAAVTLFRVGGEAYVIVRTATLRPQSVTLTSAEMAVALDVIDGLTRRAIATRRGVSERTVSNQLAAVYAKLGRISRATLFALGRSYIEAASKPSSPPVPPRDTPAAPAPPRRTPPRPARPAAR